MPKRPACNPAYQRHGGGARGRCSFDTRVPLRHPRFCKQSRRLYWRGFAASAAHCVPESRLPSWWPCCIGSQSTPSGCSDAGLVAGKPSCSVSTQCDIWNTCQVKCTVSPTRYRRRSAGCRMRRWHQWPGPARPPVLLGPGSHAGVWQLQTLTHGAAEVEFVSRIFHPPALCNRRPSLTAQVILPAAPLQSLAAMCSLPLSQRLPRINLNLRAATAGDRKATRAPPLPEPRGKTRAIRGCPRDSKS